MKKTILAMTVAMTTAGTAAAADLPRGPAPYYPPPASVYNWGGAYAGLNLGYQWGKVTNSNIEPSGIAGGGQIGYNWQSGQFVFGAEARYSGQRARTTLSLHTNFPTHGLERCAAAPASRSTIYFCTEPWVSPTGTSRAEFGGLDESKTLVGWTGGLGMEVGLTPNWSAKVEYLYMDLGSRAYTLTGADNGLQASYLRLGVNYHF